MAKKNEVIKAAGMKSTFINDAPEEDFINFNRDSHIILGKSIASSKKFEVHEAL